MVMPAYNLDDRRWADLTADGLAFIPVNAPEWTDFNPSDPGITLIELFAWLAEMNIYRLNRITDEETRKYLALVGLHPKPPQPARTVVSFALTGKAKYLTVPQHLEFFADSPSGDTVTVQALHKITVVPAALKAVQVGTSAGYCDMTNMWQQGQAFAIFGNNPAPGAALYLGFDQCLPPEVPTSLVFTVMDPTASAAARATLVAEARAQAAACQQPNYETLCGSAATPAADEANDSSPVPPHFSVSLAWEYLDQSKRWLSVTGPDVDSTRALTLNGRVEFKIPKTNPMGKWALGHLNIKYAYIRCRLVAGSYDAAPMLLNVAANAVEAVQAVPSTLSLKPSPPAPQELLEDLGPATGWPDQVCALSEKPVVAASVLFYSLESDGWHRWKLVPDLDGSGPRERRAVLDANAGTITVGNGEQGWVPLAGAKFYASYLATLADGGNLAANSSFTLASNPINQTLLSNLASSDSTTTSSDSTTTSSDSTTTSCDSTTTSSDTTTSSSTTTTSSHMATLWSDPKNPPALITLATALTGGAAAETLDQAEAQAFGIADQTTRAVSLSDYETLAGETPGVQLAIAKALPNVHPRFPCMQAPGVITVIVMPYLPAGRPTPSAGLLQAVRAYLARRRIIGTRIEVIGPNYVTVSVQATVQATKGTNTTTLTTNIINALQTFFDPLKGGLAGKGWPFGREVVQAEVLAVIGRISGVDHVVFMSLSINGGPPQCGNACVGFAGLVASGTHQVTVTGAS